MNRRTFFSGPVAGSVAIGGASALQNGVAQAPGSHSDLPSRFTPSAYSVPSTKYSPFTTPDYYTYADNLVIDRRQSGKPHAGKVLAAVQAHSDDIPLFSAGTVAKLIDEGYTGYLIRISNDESSGRTLGYGVAQNEIDNRNVAAALGCKDALGPATKHRRRGSASVSAVSSGTSPRARASRRVLPSDAGSAPRADSGDGRHPAAPDPSTSGSSRRW